MQELIHPCLAAHEHCHGVTLRRHSWLHLTAFNHESQQRILTLLFSGSTLFSNHTDNEMARMKTEMDTVKAVGLEKQAAQRRSYKPYQRLFFPHRVQTPHWYQGRQQSQQQRPYQQQQQRQPRGRAAKQPAQGEKPTAGSRP